MSASTCPTTPLRWRRRSTRGFTPLQSARGFGAEGDGAFAFFQHPGLALIVELIEAPRVRIKPEFVYPPERRLMRIESVEALPAGRSCYVRVVVEDGTTGVGESTYFGWPTAVAEIVRSFATYLEGRDALDVEHHWLALYRTLRASAGWQSQERSARSIRRSGI